MAIPSLWGRVRQMLFMVSVLAGGCWLQGDDRIEGEPVGDFESEGLLVEDSCGDAIDVPDPLESEFTLSLDEETEGRAYIDLSGAGDFTGVVDGDEYVFQTTQSWTVIEPNASVGYAGCFVTQRDVLTIVLDPVGEEDSVTEGEEASTLYTLTGSQVTDIEPVEGSDCSPAIAAAGGTFTTLPCRISYTLTGNSI